MEEWWWHAQACTVPEGEKIKEKTEEEICFSAAEMITWEKKHRKANGKYIEALRAGISNQISDKIFLIQLLLVYRVVYINVSKNAKIYIPCHVPK